MNKWKIFACISIITLVSLLTGANCRIHLPDALNECHTTEGTGQVHLICQHPDYSPSKAIDFLISHRQADIPLKTLFIQSQKNPDCKFFLLLFLLGQDFISKPPAHSGPAYSVYSKHPYTHLDKLYYLYTLKKILI